MIKVDVTFNSKLSALHRHLSAPLKDLAVFLSRRMAHRIERGQSSAGQFRPLGADSEPTSRPGLWWVPPSQPQPAGYVARPTSGPRSGWAGYESYGHYTRAMGSPPRSFKRTRQLLDSMRVRVMGPGRVKVQFAGRHAPGYDASGELTQRRNNSEIAFLASRGERDALLTPSRSELEQVRQILVTQQKRVIAAAKSQSLTRRK